MASYNMDDLIASFASTSHISQEAVDLAALQAQLSSSLMMSGPSSSRTRACPTTPTMGTMDLAPSATPSPQTNIHHSFGGPSQYASASTEDWTQDMMDEEMIEASLLGLDAQPHQPHHQHAAPASSLGLQNHYPQDEAASFSSYAAMDPFFAAQLQATQLQQQQLQLQQQQQQAAYFGGFAPARGFGARQQSGAFGSRF